MNKYVTMLKTEIKLSFRGMDMVIFALCLPVVMVVLLGIIYGNQPAFEGASYSFLEQSFGAISTIAICAGGVMGLPLVISDYRQKKILKRYKVTPTSPILLLTVQVSIYAIYSLLSLILVYLVGSLFFGVRLPGSVGIFLASYLLVMLSTFSIGMMVGGVAPNMKVASIVASVLYFPMLIFSGSIAEDFRYSTANTGDQIAESGFSGITDRSCLAPSGCHGGSDYYLRRNCGEILQVGIKK